MAHKTHMTHMTMLSDVVNETFAGYYEILLATTFDNFDSRHQSTHVYAFDHGELNRKIKKWQIPEINAVKPDKLEKMAEKLNQPVK